LDGAFTYLQVTLEQFYLHHHARAAPSDVEAENNDEADEKYDHERRDHGLPLASRSAGPASQIKQYQQTQHSFHLSSTLRACVPTSCDARLGMFLQACIFLSNMKDSPE
jgi:hypothetical protein